MHAHSLVALAFTSILSAPPPSPRGTMAPGAMPARTMATVTAHRVVVPSDTTKRCRTLRCVGLKGEMILATRQRHMPTQICRDCHGSVERDLLVISISDFNCVSFCEVTSYTARRHRYRRVTFKWQVHGRQLRWRRMADSAVSTITGNAEWH